MKISMWQSGSGFYDVFRTWTTAEFSRLGHQVVPLPPNGTSADIGDIMFSMNFSPALANVAKQLKKPYIAWIWDAIVNPGLIDAKTA